ncbi:MAG: double-strand break repair protein AddB, partial [Marivivens sp.]|nr:double-strand break repair protein AddB [Marivivens sp.]
RDMRLKSGLLLPERRIGLSAHDYQQAIAAKEVWITRAARSEEAQTVPSRWVNRLTNLLDGLADQSGPEALKAMRERGSKWIKTAEAISAADKPRGTPAPRPSPCPPVEARPKELSVTQVQTLIRDPYAIYAKKVLGLYALNPLVPTADAPLRGNIIHDVLQKFISEDHDPATPAARDRLMQLTKDELDAQCPWPATRRLWYARMDSAADWFLSTEIDRRKRGAPAKLEAWGEITLPDLDFKLKGKADRIDKTDDGQVILYDYKTGTPPSEKQQLYFDKQLILEAAMVALGAFNDIGRKEALDAEFIPIKAGAKSVRAPILTDASPKKRKDAIEDLSVDDEWTKFQLLIKAWTDPARGYTAMMAAETSAYGSDYDHLARYGEWNLSQAPKAEVLK